MFGGYIQDMKSMKNISLLAATLIFPSFLSAEPAESTSTASPVPAATASAKPVAPTALSKDTAAVESTLAKGAAAVKEKTMKAAADVKAAASKVVHPTAAGATSNVIALKDPVAIVDGVKISKADLEKAFKEALAGSGVPPASLTGDQKLQAYRQILDGMMMEKIVDQKSSNAPVSDAEVTVEIEKIKKQLPSADAFDAELKKSGLTMDQFTANLKKSIRETNWMKSQVNGKDEVTDADAQKFYNDNLKQFANPDMVKATHILFLVPKGAPESVVKAKEEAAKAAIVKANKGEDFTKLASELSEEPGAKQRGGDLGFFAKEQMVPEFATAAFAQKVGSVSPTPVKTKFGFHVIKVTDKKPAGTMPFAEAKTNIITYLQNQKRREAFKNIMQQLRQTSKIEVFLPAAVPASAVKLPAAAGMMPSTPTKTMAVSPAPSVAPTQATPAPSTAK